MLQKQMFTSQILLFIGPISTRVTVLQLAKHNVKKVHNSGKGGGGGGGGGGTGALRP